MIDQIKKEWIIHLFLLIFTLFFLWGMELVPFHPDESTQIFMSQDVFDFIKDPISLSYTPGAELTNRMTYRAIDGSLTRYLIGIARFITHSPALPADWNWSLTWEQNLEAGAYPSSALLTTARLIPALLVPISIYLFYFGIRKTLPKTPALIAAIYLGLNSLTLLHGRRAMAEPALLFGTTLFLWFLSRDRIKPIFVGLALAIAFNAKQTGAFLIPVGIIAVCFHSDEDQDLKDMLIRSAVLLAVFLFLTLLFNPYYWKSPLTAITVSYQIRSQLINLQMADYLGGARPNALALIFSLFSNLFISPPAVSEISKYLEPLSRQIQFYQGILPHSWGRGLIAGSLQFTFSLCGLFVMAKSYSSQSKPVRKRLLLWLLTTFCLTLGIFIYLPLPWQRYIVPLLPLVAFWIGYGFLPISEALQSTFSGRKLK